MKKLIIAKGKLYLIAQVLVLIMGAIFVYKQRNLILSFFLIVIYYLFIAYSSTIDNDVANESQFKDVVRRQIELKQDVLLYKRTSGELDMDLPGQSSSLPRSIQDYLFYGDKWDQSEEYIRCISYPDSCYKHKVVGVLTKGTRMRIVKVYYKYCSLLGYYLDPVVEILDNKYKGAKSYVGSQLIDCNKDSYPITLEIKDQYMQMCDPGLYSPLIEEVKADPHGVEWVERVDW